MEFNEHSGLEGKHATLSPSGYAWLNYTPERLEEVYLNNKAKVEGTLLHEFASFAIERGIKLHKLKNTINMFVNDAIGFRMSSEVKLFYSFNCFGTADAIKFEERANDKPLLRIFDLKTGKHRASFKQLEIYAALFCLEYDVDPYKIDMELRIYQLSECHIYEPEPEEVKTIMNTIIEFDMVLDAMH